MLLYSNAKFIFKGGEKEETDDLAKSSSAESIHQNTPSGTGGNSTPVQPRTASIRQRPTSSRITSAELEDLFQRQRDLKQNSLMSSSRFQGAASTTTYLLNSPTKNGRVYASVAEMKRSKSRVST